jgi:16S rRNA G966 N2-methylase RsmD
MINYGLPYQGSKSAIAPWVISCLPPGDTLVDLFCGGCAVTDAAMRAHRYKHFIINDISAMMPSTFVKALKGGFRGEDRWIDRETFFRLKNTDPYVALCFSFSNNRKDYAYGKPVEPYKKALHYAIAFDDWDPLKELCPDVIDAAYAALNGVSDRHERRSRCLAVICRQLKKNAVCRFASEKLQALKNIQHLQSLERLESLERFESLERLDLKTYNEDYRKVPIPDGSIVYCDPPYKNTGKYLVDFDHEAFYHWALTRDYPVFISEYAMPDEFAPIAIKQKTCSMSATATNIVAEKIFVQRRYADKYKRDLFL